MKVELKHDEKIVDVVGSLVSPLQSLTDEVEICLVWVPKAYYWIINNKVEHRKSYETVHSHEPPEKIEDLSDASKSSLYGIT